MHISRAAFIAAILPALFASSPSRFTLEQVLSASFPTSLTAAPAGGAIAWVLDERGMRNIWVAEPPAYSGRRLTNYDQDDGQEINELTWAPDGRSIIYVRGGDFEMGGPPPNPADLPEGVEQTIWIASLSGGAPRKLAEGSGPAISPDGKQIAFLKNHEVWCVDPRAELKPAQLFHARGQERNLRWSPDGKRLAFVSSRGDHSFIGVYDVVAKSLRYLDPSVDRDESPVWAPNGQRIAFLRIAASKAIAFGPERTAEPWSIRVADAATGDGHEIWRAAEGAGSAYREIEARDQLFWGAGDRIAFAWERTGWLHMYSVAVAGGTPVQLSTNGSFEVESVSLSPDRRDLLVSSNEGDIERRHLWRVPVAGGPSQPLSGGNGVEWTPVATSNGLSVAFLHSDSRFPARAAIQNGAGMHDLAPETIPTDFPAAQLVVPQSVIFNAADGMSIHGQLFVPHNDGDGARHPAAIFLHGGSRRQMLPAWHYMDYYSNAYAMNQYLASRGWVVLAINYRSGIGYGLNFREALNYGAAGASEFNDVLGAGVFLRGRADVDPARIALWGGSYGGYLTALGLARASDLFAAGVDFHGVHDWNLEIPTFVKSYDPLKETEAARLAFESSPIAAVSTWRSPVLLIHGDDDRNVPFSETVELVKALRRQHVDFEELILPDEIHGFLRHASWLQAYTRAARFLNARLASPY